MTGRSGGCNSFCFLDRLHRPNEFAAVMASPLRRRNGCFELRYCSNQGGEARPDGGARLGLMIPKRLAKRAVLRNLIKRLAREAFRHSRSRLPAVDVVLRLVKPPMSSSVTKPDKVLRNSWRLSIDQLLAGLAP